MLCQKCNEREATVHYVNSINGVKVETHLCKSCVEEQGDLFGHMEQMVFPFQKFLSGLLLSEAHHMTDAKKVPTIVCPACQSTYETFVGQGKFQCPQCYTAFQPALLPLFEKLHNKNTKHTGKIPKRSGEAMIFRRRISALKQELQDMVAIENFEEAARLRDEIKALEQTGKEGGSFNE